MRPMLATPGTHVPAGEEWVHEVKWDGVRVLAECDGGRLRYTNRSGEPLARRWPEPLAGPRGRDLLVDGELIALDERGVPDLRAFTESATTTYMVFDLLRLDGRDLTTRPWTERRALLEELDLAGWQVPDAYDDGAMLHAATRDQGLEGIVSKRRDSRYLPGTRSRSWLKFPHRFRGSYVVGGWRPQTGTTDRLAALLVGVPTATGLVYRGRVGSGIGDRASRTLRELLLPAATSPFAEPGVPREDAAGTHWTEPLLVVEVETHGRPVHDRLRQSVFIAPRPDLRPKDLL